MVSSVVHASDYLLNDRYNQNKSLRVINLCQSYQHQTIGYYVSLLAHARDHKAIPSVHHLQDVLNNRLTKLISQEVEDEIEHSLHDIRADNFTLSVYFGQNLAKRHACLAKKLHNLFPLPLMRFELEKKKQWHIKHLHCLAPADVPRQHTDFMKQAAIEYLSKKRFFSWKKKQRFHDLAILTDPNEGNAPSNKKALNNFAHVGEELGLNVDFIEKTDFSRSDLIEAKFCKAKAKGAFLVGADLQKVDFSEGEFQNAELSGAKLNEAILEKGVFTGADMRRADFQKANLNNINLENADLSGAKFGEASLTKANLTGAKLDGTDLKGADLSGAKGHLN